MIETFFIVWRVLYLIGALVALGYAFKTIRNDTPESKQFAKDHPAVFVLFLLIVGICWLPLVIGASLHSLLRLIGKFLTKGF
jgi:phosphate/sulfate permease